MSSLSSNQAAQRYLREHPSVAECFERDLLNLSALARAICQEHSVESFDAVLIAVRRLRTQGRLRVSREAKIRTLIDNAKIRVRTKLAVAAFEKTLTLAKRSELQSQIVKNRGDFNLIEGEESVTVITNDEYLPLLKKIVGSRLLRTNSNVVQIAMIFQPSLETTSGVVAHIYRLFAENNVNILEEMSCWTEVMVVIDEKDLSRAMDALSG